MNADTSKVIEERWEQQSARERDAWVATEVLGWRPVISETPSRKPLSWVVNGEDPGYLPHFTTDDSCAMEVLSTIVREGWSYTIDGSDTHAEVNFLDGHIETFTTFKSTLAEAVCLSALKLRASGITPIRKGQ